MDPSWGRFGAFFGAILGRLGAVLGRFSVVLGLPGVVLGRLGAVSVAVLGHPCIRWSPWAREASRGPPMREKVKTHSFCMFGGAVLGVLGAVLVCCWALVRRPGVVLGRLRAVSVAVLGPPCITRSVWAREASRRRRIPPGAETYRKTYCFFAIWGV